MTTWSKSVFANQLKPNYVNWSQTICESTEAKLRLKENSENSYHHAVVTSIPFHHEKNARVEICFSFLLARVRKRISCILQQSCQWSIRDWMFFEVSRNFLMRKLLHFVSDALRSVIHGTIYWKVNIYILVHRGLRKSRLRTTILLKSLSTPRGMLLLFKEKWSKKDDKLLISHYEYWHAYLQKKGIKLRASWKKTCSPYQNFHYHTHSAG